MIFYINRVICFSRKRNVTCTRYIQQEQTEFRFADVIIT